MSKGIGFKKGIKDGLPICIGYISVAFAFGIAAVKSGFGFGIAVLISATNVASAGQLAALPIIAGGGTLFELAAAQIVINIRYALMSISLSQKLSDKVTVPNRLWIAFMNTDEVFAVAMSNDGNVGRNYMAGLILTPFLGWVFGTFFGAVAGSILPDIITSALGLAMYAMFIAIVIPPSMKRKSTLFCVLTAVALSCAFRYLPYLSSVPSGFVIIICAILASALFAFISPYSEEDKK